ncbi:MAG: branched-chain amino acid ABC transporter permease [Rhizobiales bacterium]|nr:branched-chain amino acid ABC transporter permease [Hyphomicrobiales bacterium]
MVQTLINAISLGSIYALVALGIGLLFGVLKVINFAHGDFITIGAFALIIPSSQAAAEMGIGLMPWPLVIAGVAAVVVLTALAAEFLVFRPLRGADSATVMIASFALGYFLQSSLLLVFGSRPKSVNLWSQLNVPVVLGGAETSLLQIIIIAATALLIAGLGFLMRYTSVGLAMRAAAENFRMARLVGVRANLVIGAAIALSGILAAAVSLLIVVQTGVLSYRMGVPLMIFGFVATVIGGMGSLLGSAVGGFAVGIVSVLAQTFLPESARPFRDAVVFSVVFLVLMLRPKGLIGGGQRGERI